MPCYAKQISINSNNLSVIFWRYVKRLSSSNSSTCMHFVVCWYFSKLIFSKTSSRNTIRVSNSLDPDQDRHFVGPDLGPNCLQKLSADDKLSGFVVCRYLFQNWFFGKLRLVKEYHQSVKHVGWHFVGSDLYTNCLQKLSTYDISYRDLSIARFVFLKMTFSKSSFTNNIKVVSRRQKSWFVVGSRKILTLCLLVRSTGSLRKQFGPRSGPTKR